MKPLSVVIITYNEENNIRNCLENIKDIADEIVIVDSCSTDKTKEICSAYSVKWIEQPFLGYIEQKNFALDQATNDTVLSLDADEKLDDALKKNIVAEKEKSFPFDYYRMNRLSYFCGQWIRHGSWYPDRKIRLFNRKPARWGGTNPHDRIFTAPGAEIKYLKGDILHYAYNSIEELIRQNELYTTIQAKAMYEQGRRSGLINLIINPFIAFFSGFIIRMGFLDGYNGFIIAKLAAHSTFMKYSKLLHLRKSKKK